MTQATPQTPPTTAHPLLHSWLMIAFAVLIAAAAQWDYRLAQWYDFLRIDCLVAGIVAGIGIAFSLGGAMHFIDVALAQGIAWYWRPFLLLKKRLLMLAQLAATALVIAALAAMLFHKPIPSPDRSVLDRHWIPSSEIPNLLFL